MESHLYIVSIHTKFIAKAIKRFRILYKTGEDTIIERTEYKVIYITVS